MEASGIGRLRFTVAVAVVTALSGWACADATPPGNPAEPDRVNIAVPAQAAGEKVAVTGTPRNTDGHPSLMWDKDDIAHYREMLTSSSELQAQFAKLKAWGDKRLAEPVGVPEPKQDASGQWQFVGFLDPYKKPGDKYGYSILGRVTQQRAQDITDLGTLYALTGDEKYAEFCKKILLAYAYGYPRYGTPSGKRDNMDRISPQMLDDAMFLMKVANGYDLIHDLPSITPDERKQIEGDFIKAIAEHLKTNKYCFTSPTNWSALVACSVLMAGYATDDTGLVNTGLYWTGTKENPAGGLIGVHFSPACISEDGLWIEGAMGYQFMALGALVDTAEVMWHHGVDLYSYHDGALKKLFDSPLQFTYPDLTTPAFHDSHYGTLLDAFEINTYEYAYRRYNDPRYLAVLNKTRKSIGMTVHSGPASVLYDLPRSEAAVIPPIKSVNFFNVGYGMLRLPGDLGPNMLTLEYGPAPGHGHPDKLAIDLYGAGAPLLPDPGSIFPYGLPLYKGWYHTTLAHCTLVVDEQNQEMCAAKQTVFLPGETAGLQRAWTADAYKNVTMDRAVFLTPHYSADLFNVLAGEQHVMDLAWHVRGQFQSDLPLSPFEFSKDLKPETGYPALENVKATSAPIDGPWSATFTLNGKPTRLLAAAAPAGAAPTQIIYGDGHFEMTPRQDDHPPTLLERRRTGSTLFGNVIDLSGAEAGYVKSVTQEGDAAAGYGLLKIATNAGTDLCFTAVTPGPHTAGPLKTDALQAMVLMDGQSPTALYLAGGTNLSIEKQSIQRSEPGLAFIERAADGSYTVGNPSPSEATITVELDDAASLHAELPLDHPDGRSLAIKLPAGATVRLSKK